MMRKKLGIFLAVALAFGGLPLLATSTHAFASWDWCWDDPIVSINHQTVSIAVGVDKDLKHSVQSGTVIVHVPRRADTSIDATQDTLPLTTSFQYDAQEGHSWVEVLVNTNNHKNIAVEVKITVAYKIVVIDGTANHTIKAQIPD